MNADSVFQPVDGYELKITFKGFGSPMTITKIAAPGATVTKGETLFEADPQQINWVVTGAENDLAAAQANLTKAESDQTLGTKADAMSLRQQEEAVKNADAAVKWWSEVDGPQMLLSADLQTKAYKDNLDDQNDELDQLKKMYKSEELTNATADIVVKRSVRQLENSKISLKMQEERREKVKSFEYAMSKARVTDAAAAQHQALEFLKASQQQGAVVRQATVTAARLAFEQGVKRLNDLKADQAQFTIKSPVDGVVAYGALIEGVWVGGDPKSFKAGEKVAAGGVLLRVFTPGKMKVVLGLTEPQAFWVEPGAKARIVPAAFPLTSYEAACGPVELTPRGNPPTLGFQVTLQPGEVDPRLVPGMHAAVHLDVAKVEKALLIPVAAVSSTGGATKVTIRKEGRNDERTVKLGKSDGQQVEVVSGLNEGDEVVLPGKK